MWTTEGQLRNWWLGLVAEFRVSKYLYKNQEFEFPSHLSKPSSGEMWLCQGKGVGFALVSLHKTWKSTCRLIHLLVRHLAHSQDPLSFPEDREEKPTSGSQGIWYFEVQPRQVGCSRAKNRGGKWPEKPCL